MFDPDDLTAGTIGDCEQPMNTSLLHCVYFSVVYSFVVFMDVSSMADVVICYEPWLKVAEHSFAGGQR